jgi:dihydrolipoamide dehydrogenase
MTRDSYDAIVLGGGAGGVPAAIRAAQLGGHVAIIECEKFGGQCMNKGCIPFGHMMAASKILTSLSLGKEMGLSFTGISKDYTVLKRRQEKLIEFMRQGIRSTLKKNGVEIIEGRARIAGKGRVAVNGLTVPFGNLILASGAAWLKADFPGADLEGVVTSDYLLSSEQLPQRVLLFGRSPWLIEIAQFLRRFGSEVTLATAEKRILSDESKTISARLRKVLVREGIILRTRAQIVAASKREDGLRVDINSRDGTEAVMVDKVITLERAAALKELGLSTVELDQEGQYIAVNRRMETSTAGIYAIGDLTGPPSRHYSHLAAEMGIIAAENVMGGDVALDPRTLTRILYTQPEIACVGLTPKAAKKEGYDVMVGTAPLSMNPFGMVIAEGEGVVEVVAEREYGEILGVHFIGTAGSEMAGQAVMAIRMEATLDDLSKIPFPHPTLSESLAEAARDAIGKPIYLP